MVSEKEIRVINSLRKYFDHLFVNGFFARLHPNFGFSVANFFSKTSRSKNGPRDKQFNGIENEWLYNYSKEVNTNNKFDFLFMAIVTYL